MLRARRSDGLEAAKWIAIVLMSVNHALLALPGPWPEIGHLAGRPCVALFATILAARLADGGPERSGRAFRRLLIWAVIAEPVYYALTGKLVIRADILFVLAAGAGLVWLIRKRQWAALALAAAGIIAADRWLDGGALSVAAVAVGWMVTRHRPALAPWAVAATAVAANLWSSPGLPWAALAVFAAPLILWACQRLPAAPRGPRLFFYAYYPAHLLVILLALGAYG